MKPICSEPDCGKPVMCKGWCSRHYYRLRTTSPCAVEGCTRPVESKGYCGPHYNRFRRHGDPEAGGTERGAPWAWIEAHSGHHDSGACLIWPFARSGSGYGFVRHEGNDVLVHRLICERAHGAPPTTDHEAAHSCGKGHEGCVNPLHLRWATTSENALDAMRHGTKHTMLKGEGHKLAKLTEDSVRDIRVRRSAGETARSLAKEYGVGTPCISQITTGKTWAHVQ